MTACEKLRDGCVLEYVELQFVIESIVEFGGLSCKGGNVRFNDALNIFYLWL